MTRYLDRDTDENLLRARVQIGSQAMRHLGVLQARRGQMTRYPRTGRTAKQAEQPSGILIQDYLAQGYR